MPKFVSLIGFEVTEETPEGSGKYVEHITERKYFSDIIRNSRRLQQSDKINDDVAISNQVSIVADQFAYNNFHTMRYATFMGQKYKVTDIEVQQPRLLLTLGGLYNVEETRTPGQT